MTVEGISNFILYTGIVLGVLYIIIGGYNDYQRSKRKTHRRKPQHKADHSDDRPLSPWEIMYLKDAQQRFMDWWK